MPSACVPPIATSTARPAITKAALESVTVVVAEMVVFRAASTIAPSVQLIEIVCWTSASAPEITTAPQLQLIVVPTPTVTSNPEIAIASVVTSIVVFGERADPIRFILGSLMIGVAVLWSETHRRRAAGL